MRCLDSHLKWRGLVFFFFFFFLAPPPLLKLCKCLRCVVPLKTLSFACGLIAGIECLYSEWTPAQKSPPKGWKEFKALKRQKGLSWDFFLCTLKRRIKYKFPIGSCYGSGTRIKSIMLRHKGQPEMVRAHHMRRRNENNSERAVILQHETSECSFWHAIEGTRNWKEVIFDQVFCLNRL